MIEQDQNAALGTGTPLSEAEVFDGLRAAQKLLAKATRASKALSALAIEDLERASEITGISSPLVDEHRLRKQQKKK